jgi:hypothetical protein
MVKLIPASKSLLEGVAERMRLLDEQTNILVVVATDNPYISEAIEVLASRRIPVVRLPSDLSAPQRPLFLS